MKYLFIAIVILHGLIHLMGFAKAFRLAELDQLTSPISKPMGIIWLTASLFLLFGGVLYIINKPHAWQITGVGFIISVFLIISFWKDARIGMIVNALLLPVLLTNLGSWNFERKAHQSVKEMLAVSNQQVIRESDIQSLPAPVHGWLNKVAASNELTTSYAKIIQCGTMRTSPNASWSSFHATHWASFDKPGFVWCAKMDVGPGLHVAVMDKFVEGKGSMEIELQSLINMDNASGPAIDEGAMQRYLAEIVWTPSFALSPYISWEPLDKHRAKATMNFQNSKASVVFTFNAEGLVKQVEANRFYYQKNGHTKERWVVTIDESSYKRFNGALIPAKSSITWKLNQGDFNWFQLEVLAVHLNSK